MCGQNRSIFAATKTSTAEKLAALCKQACSLVCERIICSDLSKNQPKCPSNLPCTVARQQVTTGGWGSRGSYMGKLTRCKLGTSAGGFGIVQPNIANRMPVAADYIAYYPTFTDTQLKIKCCTYSDSSATLPIYKITHLHPTIHTLAHVDTSAHSHIVQRVHTCTPTNVSLSTLYLSVTNKQKGKMGKEGRRLHVTNSEPTKCSKTAMPFRHIFSP